MVKVETEFDRAMRYYKNEVSIVQHPLLSRTIKKEEYKLLISQYWDLATYRIIWEILWETGMRPIEACWLQLENIDLENKQIGYKIAKPSIKKKNGKTTKVYKSRIVPISDYLTEKMKKYIELNNGSFRYGFLFPSPYLQSRVYLNPRNLNNEMDRLRKIFGGRWLEKTSSGDHLIGPHSFRRSWIARYQRKCKDPMETARAIGHSSLEVSYGYYQEINKERMRMFVNEEIEEEKEKKVSS